MKKRVLFFTGLCASAALKAQLPSLPVPQSTRFTGKTITEPLKQFSPLAGAPDLRQPFIRLTEGRELTFIPIGASGNAYGYYGDPRTYIWADPRINSVVFTHRMIDEAGTYGNSRVAYDVSTQKGANGSWHNNVKVYEPLGPGTPYPEAAGRYPEGAIYNPPGNTDPDNAYFAYFIPTIDNSNGAGIWGGYAYGVNGLTTFLPPSPTQYNVTSGGDYWRVIPNAYTITQDGHAWMVDGSFTESGGAYTYTGDMIVNHGTWDPDEADYVYDEYLLEMLGAADGINDTKIAFAPDGQTGYICIMSDSPSDPQDYNGYHPILYKTTNGGEDWDGPVHVLLGGYDGIESVKYYWDDEAIMSVDIYANGFDRDTVYYNMGFHVDMVVDENGNPHLTGLISVAVPDGWYPYEGLMATWHIWSDDGGEAFEATPLYNNRYFEGTFGEIAEWNRPQISTTTNGRYIFISWLDTDFEGIEANTQPDIYCVAKDLVNGTYTDVSNVTQFTQSWLQSWMGSQSHYVFVEDNGTDLIATVPFVYMEMNPEDPTLEVSYWYIDGWTYTFAKPVGEKEIPGTIDNIIRNYPNPFHGTTQVQVSLVLDSEVGIEVTNLFGQMVLHYHYGWRTEGTHVLTIEGSNLPSGAYFLTILAGRDRMTTKITVE
jgi:hypothetical protein